jgi:cytochrome c oxidase assembly protein subunit 15
MIEVLYQQQQTVVQQRSSRPVAIWLLVGVFMIIVQIILGGITRLTDSGLSITEWQPILGTIPPMNEAQWNEAFDKYKQIAQYQHLHAYFTLEDFKSIFFWEWMHRVWGRLIGIVFFIPFIIFLVQRRFSKEMVTPMVILFLLGGLQGAIGWIMVKSGLNDENLYVSHIRLAIHFITALGLLVYTWWFALRLVVQKKQMIFSPSSKKLLGWIIGLLVLQLAYGAFMAGLKAAYGCPHLAFYQRQLPAGWHKLFSRQRRNIFFRAGEQSGDHSFYSPQPCLCADYPDCHLGVSGSKESRFCLVK